MALASIRTGIGGWTFDPWDESFYPRSLPEAAAGICQPPVTGDRGQLAPIIPARSGNLRQMGIEVPEDFVFSLKASRFCPTERSWRKPVHQWKSSWGKALLNSVPSRADPVAVHGHTRSSSQTISRRFCNCCRRRWRVCHYAMWWSRAMKASARRIRRDSGEIRHSRRLRRSSRISDVCRCHRGLRLCPPAEGHG